jgi:hypothetical protein
MHRRGQSLHDSSVRAPDCRFRCCEHMGPGLGASVRACITRIIYRPLPWCSCATPLHDNHSSFFHPTPTPSSLFPSTRSHLPTLPLQLPVASNRPNSNSRLSSAPTPLHHAIAMNATKILQQGRQPMIRFLGKRTTPSSEFGPSRDRLGAPN